VFNAAKSKSERPGRRKENSSSALCVEVNREARLGEFQHNVSQLPVGAIESAGRAADKFLGEVDTFDAGYITFFPSSGNSIQNDRSLGETIKGTTQMQGIKIEKRIP